MASQGMLSAFQVLRRSITTDGCIRITRILFAWSPVTGMRPVIKTYCKQSFLQLRVEFTLLIVASLHYRVSVRKQQAHYYNLDGQWRMGSRSPPVANVPATNRIMDNASQFPITMYRTCCISRTRGRAINGRNCGQSLNNLSRCQILRSLKLS
eukprot:1209906-Pleurochrysis_carterae.AAC.1